MAYKGRARAGSGIPLGFLLLSAAFVIFIGSFLIAPHHLMPGTAHMLYSLVFFITSSYFLGYSLTSGIFGTSDKVELFFMRIGFGLSTIPLLTVIMETIGVPLAWRTILALALIRPTYDLIRGSITPGSMRIPLSSFDIHSCAAALIFALAFALAIFGSYMYVYLEDGDSWEHAVGVKYVSLFESYSPPEGFVTAHYLKPYPPAYDTLLGIVHQLNSSVSWSLKAFNALLVALSYAFAFFFVRRLTGDSRMGLYTIVILFTLPPFGSHTIWAHTLSAALFFPVFYAVSRVREGLEWAVVSAVFLASSLLVQSIMALVMVAFLLFYLLPIAWGNRLLGKRLIAVGLAGLALSGIYWVPLALFSKTKGELGDVATDISAGKLRLGVSAPNELPTAMQAFFPLDCSISSGCTSHGDIYMQQGFGIVVLILAAVTLDHLLRCDFRRLLRDRPWLIAVSAWFVSSLLALYSGGYDISVYPTRFWGIAAIPLAILSSFGLTLLGSAKWIPKKATKYVLPIVLLGLAVTSFTPKAIVQTTPWGSDLTYTGYGVLMNLTAGTPVYPFCSKDAFVIGFDKLSYPWDRQVAESRDKTVSADPQKLHRLLQKKGYEWVIFDFNCVRRCMDSDNRTREDCRDTFATTLKGLEDSRLFKTQYTDPTVSLFSIN